MATNYYCDGNAIDYKNSGSTAVLSGSVVVLGGMVGIASTTIPAGGEGSLRTTGVWELPKKATDVITTGTPLYWAESGKFLTITESGNKLAGKAWCDAGNGVMWLYIKINV